MKFHNGEPRHRRGREVLVRALPRRRAPRRSRSGSPRVETPDPARVRFRLKQPVARLHDLLRHAGHAARAGSCRRSTSRRSATTGFKKAPVGAGPYQFVSFTPGVELVLEAFDGYWRKTPSVKRLVFKVDPRRGDAAGRAQARRGRHRLLDPRRARRGAAAHAGAHAEADGDPGARTGSSSPTSGTRSRRGTTGACGWPPTSPSTARRINQAVTLGLSQAHRQHHPEHASTSTGSRRAYAYDPGAGQDSSSPRPATRTASTPATTTATSRTPTCGEADRQLPAAGRHPDQAAAARARGVHWSSYADKKLKNLIYTASGAFGNAATRLEAFVVAGGAYVYGSYPDIDGALPGAGRRARPQEARGDAAPDPAAHARQGDVRRRSGSWPSSTASGPRVAESGLGLIAGHAYSAPYEDVKLKAK